jgi:maltooligosyltrehalose synthase
LEQRLEQNILAKLPVAPEHMEVDGQEHRLQALEQQMHALSGRQTALETTVNENHAQSAAQVQSLQQQMLVQMDTQSKQMQAMLSDQMIRLESILSKKPRTE